MKTLPTQDEKTKRNTLIPELFKTLETEGCIVTIDAMGCQKKVAEAIVEKKADYIFSLKGNQSNLHSVDVWDTRLR